MFTTGTEF